MRRRLSPSQEGASPERKCGASVLDVQPQAVRNECLLCTPPPVALVPAAALGQAGSEAGRKEVPAPGGLCHHTACSAGKALRAVDRTAALCVAITPHSGRGSERVWEGGPSAERCGEVSWPNGCL